MSIGSFSPNVLDGDVERLFTIGQMVIIDIGGEIKEFFMRVPSEQDITESRLYALRFANEFRKNINNDDSFKMAIIPQDIYNMSKEQLVDAILYTQVDSIVDDAIRLVSIPFPKEPKSDARQEEWERYVKESDEWPKKFSEELDKQVKAILKSRRDKYMSMDDDDLIKIFENEVINSYVESESNKRFAAYLIYRITFTDDTMESRVFKSADDVLNLPVNIFDKFLEYYRELAMDVGNLKKLPVV